MLLWYTISLGQYSGLSDCIIQLYRQEGMMGFFKVIDWCVSFWTLFCRFHGFWNIFLSISWVLECIPKKFHRYHHHHHYRYHHYHHNYITNMQIGLGASLLETWYVLCIPTPHHHHPPPLHHHHHHSHDDNHYHYNHDYLQ